MDDYLLNYNIRHKQHLESCKNNKEINETNINFVHKKYNKEYYLEKNKIYKGDIAAINYWKYISTVKNKELYDFQEELLKQYFHLTLPQFYYEDWNESKNTILAMYGFEREYKFQVYRTSRKEGKTFVSCLHVMSAIMATPYRKEPFMIALLSLSLAGSMDMLSKCFELSNSMVYDEKKIKINYHMKKMQVFFSDGKNTLLGVSIVKAFASGPNAVSILLLLLFFNYFYIYFHIYLGKNYRMILLGCFLLLINNR